MEIQIDFMCPFILFGLRQAWLGLAWLGQGKCPQKELGLSSKKSISQKYVPFLGVHDLWLEMPTESIERKTR